MEGVDMTGKPRSDGDLQEAINAVEQIMIKQTTVLPLFTIHAMDIRSFLLELQHYRKLIAELKEKRRTGEG